MLSFCFTFSSCVYGLTITFSFNCSDLLPWTLLMGIKLKTKTLKREEHSRYRTSLLAKLAWDWQTKGTGILDRNLISFIPWVNYTDAAHNHVVQMASHWSGPAILASYWLLYKHSYRVLSTSRGRGRVFTYLYFWYKEQRSNNRTITPSLIHPHPILHRYCSHRRGAVNWTFNT